MGEGQGEGAAITRIAYDGGGRVVSTTDALGNTTEYEYDPLGRLTTVTDAEESETEYAYDAAGNLATVTDALDNVTSHDYDNLGRLVEITEPDPDGGGAQTSPVAEYDYDANGNLTSVTDPRDYEATYDYDEADRLIAVNLPDPDGGGPLGILTTEYEYDDAGNLVTVTDPLDNEATYEYDALGRLITVTLPDPDGGGAQTSPVTEYEYDAYGDLVAATDPLDNTTTYQYNAIGQLTAVTDALGNTTSYLYDAAGNLLWATEPLTDDDVLSAYALGATTEYQYDSMDRVVKVTASKPDDSEENLAPIITYEYDAIGNLVSLTDPEGNTTTYEYDGLWRLIKVTKPDPDGGGAQTSPVTEYEYDALGNLVTVTDPLDNETTYEYDNLGRLISVTQPDPDGGGAQTSPVTEYAYDAAGNLITVTDPLDNETTYQYDGLGRLVTVTEADPDGGGAQTSSVTEYEYDAVGNLVTFTDPLDNETTYEYDNLGQLIRVTEPDPDGGGAQTSPVTEYEYDAVGNLITVTDPLDNETTYDYDNLGRLLLVTDAELGETAYTYDAVGNLLTLTDPEENTTTWTYDSLGRVIEETNQLEDTRYYVYNAVGLLVEKTDREGRVTTYEYDSLYRLLEENWLDSQQQVEHTISYTYDAVGNLLTASDPTASYAYQYDGLGRVYEETQTIAGLTPVVVFSSQYSVVSRRTQLAAEIGGVDDFVNDYTYDNLNRLTRLTQDDQAGNAVAEKRVDFTYNAASRYDTITRYKDTDGGAANLVMTGTYDFDALGRLTSLVYADSTPSTIRSFEWTYDAASRMVSHDSDIASEDVTAYTHDDTNQLTDADYTTGTDESYAYDDNGNRVTANGDSYETDTNNRLVSDDYYRYQYDAEGNLVYRYVDADSSETLNTGDTDITEYDWDHRNRMTDVAHKAVFGGSVDWTAEYIYDAFNRRIGALYDTDGDSALDLEERYVWNGRNVVLDFIDSDGDGGGASLELTNRYLWGNAVDQLLAQETVDDGGVEDVLWPVTDNLGSVRSLVDYLGDITATYSYDTFGNVTVQAGLITDTRYGFTCQEYDLTTGLYYYDARWYDPAIGKFISIDPISFFGGDANLYRYVSNNPLTNRDPLGWCKEEKGENGAGKPSKPEAATPTKPGKTERIKIANGMTVYLPQGAQILRYTKNTVTIRLANGKEVTLNKMSSRAECIFRMEAQSRGVPPKIIDIMIEVAEGTVVEEGKPSKYNDGTHNYCEEWVKTFQANIKARLMEEGYTGRIKEDSNGTIKEFYMDFFVIPAHATGNTLFNAWWNLQSWPLGQQHTVVRVTIKGEKGEDVTFFIDSGILARPNIDINQLSGGSTHISPESVVPPDWKGLNEPTPPNPPRRPNRYHPAAPNTPLKPNEISPGYTYGDAWFDRQ